MEEETKKPTGALPEEDPDGDLTDEDLEDGGNEPEGEGEPKPEEGEEKPQKPEGQQKKPQSRREDAAYAQLRREKKALEEQLKRLQAEQQKAVFEAKKGAVPSEVLEALGIKGVEDEDDLYLANSYMEAERKGSDDPLGEAQAALAKKLRAEKRTADQQRLQEEEQNKALQQDKANFKAKYGEEKLVEILQEGSRFMELFGDMVQPGNLTSLYERYAKAFPDEAAKKPNGAGSPPTPSGRTSMPSHDESDAEFKKRYENQYGSW